MGETKVADAISIQDFKNGSLDVKSLGEAANGDDNTQVVTRTGETYPSAKKAIKTMFANGGLPAQPFATKALMTASALANGSYAQVTDDTANNGLYLKTAGAWVKSAYDPLKKAMDYIDDAGVITKTYNVADFSVNGVYIQSTNGVELPSAYYQATPYLPASPNSTYYYSVQTADNIGGAWYDKNKVFISGFGASSSPSSVLTVISPMGAAFVRIANNKLNPNPNIKEYGVFNKDKIFEIIDSYPKSKLLTQEHTHDSYTKIDAFIKKSTGALEINTAYQATDYIKVEPSVAYKVLSIGGGDAGCAWYDKDKVFISGFEAVTAKEVTSPVNAAYVRLSALKINIAKSYFQSASERFDIDKILSIVNTHLDIGGDDGVLSVVNKLEKTIKDPMHNETIVNSKSELLAVVPQGVGEKAYPIGRRVYDHSLRSEVIADGAFWRMPDGSAAGLAPRTYIFPDWEEQRAALPNHAVAHKVVYVAKTTKDTGWVSTTSAPLNAYMSDEYGDNRLCIEHKLGDSAKYIYLANNSALNLNSYLIFDFWADFSQTSNDSEVSLHAADGTLLFKQQLQSTIQGTEGKPYYSLEHVKAEVQVKKMTPAFVGASLANVRHIGFKTLRVSANPTGTGRLYLGNIETVTFRPMITLRFDDQRPTVYSNAVPIINSYGFKGLIAVVTGKPELGNDPYLVGDTGMTKAQLLEVQSSGWDLIAHTHTHTKDVRSDEYMREDYRKCREYLRKELNTGELTSSILCTPNGNYDERVAKIQREFYDCNLNGSYLNSTMPRQPTGNWRRGNLWTSIGSFTADNKTTVAPLIAAAQAAIDNERWTVFMMHEVDTTANAVTIPTNVFSEFCAWLDEHRSEIDVVTITDVVRKTRPAL